MLDLTILAMSMVALHFGSYDYGCKHGSCGDAGHAQGVLAHGDDGFHAYNYGGCIVAMHPRRYLMDILWTPCGDSHVTP